MVEDLGRDLGISGLSRGKHLGTGGSAQVFAAKHEESGEVVAVKVLRSSADSTSDRKRFERETEVLQKLSEHEGIVPIIDSGISDLGEPFFLMPVMSASLQEQIDDGGPLPWADAAALVAEVADAVEHAHAHDVLHRDIKPGNVLLDQFGRPRISDFGIAKLTDTADSKSSKALGTTAFMAPERFDHVEPAPQSDVYGLAATLAALITGTPPFTTGAQDTDAMVLKRVLMQDPEPISTPGVPESVSELIVRSMAKDAAERPATAAGFAEELRAVLADEGALPSAPVTVARAKMRDIRTFDLPEPEELANERGKRPLLFLAAAALLVIAAVSGVFLLTTSGDGPTTVASEGLDEAADAAGASEDDSGSFAESDESTSASSAEDEDEGELSAAGTDEQESAAGGEADDGAGSAAAGTSIGADTAVVENDAEVDANTGDASSAVAGATVSSTTEEETRAADESAKPEEGSTSERATDPVDPPSPPAPVACFRTSASTVDVNDTVTLTNCSSNASTYAWDFGDGQRSATASPRHSWNRADSFTITLTATGEGGSDSTTARIRVNAKEVAVPPPDACIEIDGSSPRVNESFAARSCSTGATSLLWEFGDGQTSSATNPDHRYSSSGTRTLKLTASGPGGTDVATRQITVKPAAIDAVAPEAPQSVRCAFNTATDVVWTWAVYARVDTYLIKFSNGSIEDIGKTGQFPTTDNSVSQIIASYQGLQTPRNVGSCEAEGGQKPQVGAPPGPTGIRCRITEWYPNAANNNWAGWDEVWSWTVDPSVDEYVLTINNNGSTQTQSRTTGSWGPNRNAGQANVGVALRTITAVRDGLSTPVNVANCTKHGGEWIEHPNYNN